MQHPIGFSDGPLGSIERQRSPRCQRGDVNLRGIRVGAVTDGHAALILAFTTTRHDGVDVHGIDLARETGASSMIGRCALAQQNQHDFVAVILMRRVGSACGRRRQAGVKPEISNLHRVVVGQRLVTAERCVKWVAGLCHHSNHTTFDKSGAHAASREGGNGWLERYRG